MTPRRSYARLSRRAFLAGAAVGSAGLLAVAASPGGPSVAAHDMTEGAARRDDSPPGAATAFDHVVVLMLENRSYDHLLGWLDRDEELRPGQHVAGLFQNPSSNTAPDGTVVEAYRYTGTRNERLVQPTTNSGEDLRHVDRQLFGSAPARGLPTMSGFVADYIDNYRSIHSRDPSLDAYRQVMGGFTPDTLPVLSTLARSFGVFDHWFGSVPSDTFCNRSFVHAGTSHGYVTNAGHGGYRKWLDAPAVPTLFNRLEDRGLPWRVYYDETQAVSLTGILAAPSLEPYWQSNFRNMAQFSADAKAGRLPAYSFIEPRMIFNRNSMHPARAASPTSSGVPSPSSKGVTDMIAGEALIEQVYEAIRASASQAGSNASNTALIITFDESGGLFDHVPPPAAPPPGDRPEPGEWGFLFDRLGARVPAIIVSAWTDAGSVINETLDHTAIIATVSERHHLAPLTDRDAASSTLAAAVTRTSPRPASDWPLLKAPRVPRPLVPSRAPTPHPQTATSLGILGLVLARFEPGEPLPTSTSAAFDTLVDRGTGLFGTRDLERL